MKRKILYALLSAVIAIGLWVYVVTVVSPESEETYRNISVVIDGESLLHDRGLMIVTENIPQVTLKLSGNRSDLRKLNSSNITIVMDVSRISSTGEKELQYSISYPGDVPSGSIQVMSQSPERIKVTVVEAARVTLPIEETISGTVNTPYWVDSEKITKSHNKVQISGPADVIAKISKATVTADINGKTETIKENHKIVLLDAEGNVIENSLLTMDVTEVTVTVPIYLTKEVPLTYPNLKYGGGTNEQNTKLVGLPATVKVYGNEQVISKLEKIVLRDPIDLSRYANDETFEIDIADSLDLGVYLDKEQESVITVKVQITGLKTSKFSVDRSNITIIDPAGFRAILSEKEFSVELRGPADKLANLNPEHIKVTVDASNVNGDGDKAKYTVELPAEFAATVGAFGACTVTVNLTPLA